MLILSQLIFLVCDMSTFCWLVKGCNFLDLGFSVPAYTWSNKQFATNPVFERLDRCLGNPEWCAALPASTVLHLPMMKSDHAPILMVLQSNRAKPKKPFRFENWWLLEADFQREASASWVKSSSRPFHLKTAYLASDLKKWRKKQPSIHGQLQQIETCISQIQSSPPNLQNHDVEKHLILQHHNILEKQAIFHRQRYKKMWSVDGYRNTHFFQQAIVKRARRNELFI